ncbi:hypothetical protein AU255_18065 [Methyloprofundus sedimenti]|uniref:DUF4194 domain-containing protein n=1 Tax=Methyloprofundus sedimenti TaxID=1420851 RepID=A0A1V8M1K5_9GAMM|nr:DUF4194 domain-containing protein [Methyloprofundus sedimenti]OQK15376.1 hypothetical protein AU255_18065 [Methyloprofundus sedimenti]
MTEEEHQPSISPIIIHLLKGILFRNQQPMLWHDLLSLQSQVLDYVKVMGLDLAIDDTEGYAWLTQSIPDEDEKDPLPRLIARRPLSYPISLLCVLLRKKMAEADSSGADIRVIVSRQELSNAMLVFMPEKSNEAQISASINATINKVIELGFLRKLTNDNENLEIQRIISALVDADWTADFNQKLATYQAYAESTD